MGIFTKLSIANGKGVGMATPSAFHLDLIVINFALDTVQPGWREIELHDDGRIETRVKRIQHASFLRKYVK